MKSNTVLDQPKETLLHSLSEQEEAEVELVTRHFLLPGELISVQRINAGYINRTYKLTTEDPTTHKTRFYTLQRINNEVFPDVDALMDNFMLVTQHLYPRLMLSGKQEGMGCVQGIRLTHEKKSFYHGKSGYWRMLTHFCNVYSLDVPDSVKTFYEAGRAFGSFMKEMADIPVDRIKITIPNFHNTRSRYMDLEKAIKNDLVGKVEEVQKEIDFVRENAHLFGLISDALDAGDIPTRICHNDCNLNNILFDRKSSLPVAIIDLDTVMPASPLYDFGDSMRIGTNPAKDDETDLSKVYCDLDFYASYARGYLESCGSMLTKKELELLPYSSLIITMEDGIRFLMDYINGDVYYTTTYPGQNLDRARNQLHLFQDSKNKLMQIKGILQNLYEELGLSANAFALTLS